jgi:hypothetical protein
MAAEGYHAGGMCYDCQRVYGPAWAVLPRKEYVKSTGAGKGTYPRLITHNTTKAYQGTEV